MTDPSLPVVWRPRTTRIIGYGLAGAIVLSVVVLAIVLPPTWGVADRVALVLFGALVAWILHVLARCRVVADERGLTVVNAVATRRYDWAEIVGVSMERGAPWPTLDLAGGDSISAMGINGAEHALAAGQLTELRALLKRHAEAADR